MRVIIIWQQHQRKGSIASIMRRGVLRGKRVVIAANGAGGSKTRRRNIAIMAASSLISGEMA